MNDLPSQLARLLQYEPFRRYHRRKLTAADVRGFLNATMDEVRTTASSKIALKVLGLTGMADFGAFRSAVLRRELTENITYPKQRDHASHTVHNYLLGWHFYKSSPRLRDALRSEFLKRGVSNIERQPFSRDSEYFGSLWPYVSLLHDIGYMFEGGIPSLGFRRSSDQAAIGQGVARDYFNRTLWVEHDLEMTATRERFLQLLAVPVPPPTFSRPEATLADIADELRSLGSISRLASTVKTACSELGLAAEKCLSESDPPDDAFSLWIDHYARFGQVAMAKRMRAVRQAFNGMIDNGLHGANARVLDHGVCGGMLQLLAATYYYRLRDAASGVSRPGPPSVAIFLRNTKWDPAFWWTGIVWATAAAAVHNVQQLDSVKQLASSWPGPLKLEEDPLAYLGILVDIVQSWDRYWVSKALDREPLQGTEVALWNRQGRVVLRFRGRGGAAIATKLRKELDLVLDDWAALAEVEP